MNDSFYDHTAIEKKWQQKWKEASLHATDLEKANKPFYSLVMFPYPSGDKLHIGHWFNYAPADSYARFKRLQGYDTFSPMGFDAFGLPAENYAIKTGTPPAESTAKNVQTMIEQLSRIGCMYDWDKMVNTTDPEYYRWTQWLFIELYKNKLAYKKMGNVNFCPSCQTVLANEQVKEGACERCSTTVLQKPLEQWYFAITKYSQTLLDGLETLDWPEKTKLMQRNWIGRSDGAEVVFEVEERKRGLIGPINWPVNNRSLAADLDSTSSPQVNRQLTDENKQRIHSRLRTVHLVFTPHERSQPFESSANAQLILRILDDVADRHDIILHEASAMPDHVHVLVSFDESRHLENDIVKKLKGASAREFLKDKTPELAHLWGQKKHFVDVLDADQFEATALYIRENPSKDSIDPHHRILSSLPIRLTVFTTRVDTIFSAAFLVLAPEHPLVKTLTTESQRSTVDTYCKEVEKKTEIQRTDTAKEKTGAFIGAYAINPANGHKIPIWIADFVLAHYGHGAVFGDAHDERDFEFAKKYSIPLTTTIRPADSEDDTDIRLLKTCFTGDGILYNSGQFDGLASGEAREKIAKWLETKAAGTQIIQYRLRDWLLSRQRYWGAPIPIVYDPEGNAHPVPAEHLPWLLPTDVEFKPTGESPLRDSKEFKERTENIFGKGWTPEYDTMDTFVCSSFYYLRYLAKGYTQQLIDKELEKKWMPVSMYIGGAEHACMHLIYARFVMMALKDFGYTTHSEPFKKLVHQGTVTNKGAKMSKSKGNVVSPDSFVEKFGSDVFRMYLMFMGPFEAGGDWNDLGINGIVRFVQRLWKILSSRANEASAESAAVTVQLHKTIKKVGEDIEVLHFNTAISALMQLLNLLEKEASISLETKKTLAILIAPLAPHFADEVWSLLGQTGFIVQQQWPTFDPSLLQEKTVTIAVQVNGKVRGELQIDADASKEKIFQQAKELENVQKHLVGPVKKEIYVPQKLVSFVV